jgi:polysaccharide deacetylase family protein (PEP-CTERM system associated)
MRDAVESFHVARTCVFTIDVEDWYHIMDVATAPPIEQWPDMPPHVERNFAGLLDMLDGRRIKATCFFLGWCAERFPHMVREAAARGHEVASHGYAHGLIHRMSRDEVLADLSRAKALLEDLTGKPVTGYRAPGFSVTDASPWFFETVAQAGYRYSSSIFPAKHGHGGIRGFSTRPCKVVTDSGSVYEFPISVAPVGGGRDVCFFGGGYLRLFPYAVIRSMARRVLADDRPVVFYIHPREIDPDHPRIEMPFVRRVKSYIGLRSTRGKLERILADFPFKTFSELIPT